MLKPFPIWRLDGVGGIGIDELGKLRGNCLEIRIGVHRLILPGGIIQWHWVVWAWISFQDKVPFPL